MAKLYFKYGAMGSSKTAQALITTYNYEENDMKVWLVKPSADTRDGAQILRSRIGLQAEVDVMTPAMDVYRIFEEKKRNCCNVVIVDECQFMTRDRSISCAPLWMISMCRCCASVCAPISRPSCSPVPAG